MWIKCACGDAVRTDYIKRFFIETTGFGLSQKFIVNAVVDGGAKSDDWVIVDVFTDREEAKRFISVLIGDVSFG